MKYDEIMVRYGELSTKGKNRRQFIDQLGNNIKRALHAYPEVRIRAKHDRMHLLLNGADSQGVSQALKNIFGIANFSPSVRVEKNMAAIKAAAVELVKKTYQAGDTFKVNARRADKGFELDSMELNRDVGAAIFNALPDLTVEMHQPTITVRLEVRHEGAFLAAETIAGRGGLPVGSSGLGMLMLSGGIDSPVAGYLGMKRGMEIEAVHFHSPPYTSPEALKKAKDLTAKLAPYVGSIQFLAVPFTEIQEEIKQKVPQGYLMTVTRRFMMRITDRIRAERQGLAIVNGESLGQVASQTLESMLAINDVTNTPVIRPVVTLDKTEIIDLAEEIDTFELAIQPFEDCCTIFAPPQPKTKPKLSQCERYEERLDVDGLIERAIAGIEITEIFASDLDEAPEEEAFAGLL